MVRYPLVCPSARPLLQVSYNLVRGVSRVTIARRLVPRPALGVFGVEGALHHGHDVLADDRQEFPAVERPARGHVQIVTMRVWRDEEVVRWRRSVPVFVLSVRVTRTLLCLSRRVYVCVS